MKPDHTKSDSVSRRQILRGAGGFTLALPCLPSLLPREAQAAFAPRKRFIAMISRHGGVAPSAMYPQTAFSDQTEILPGYPAKHHRLQRTTDGMNASLSQVLTAKATDFTDRLVAKMNILRGLDTPFHVNHWGGHLGNFASHSAPYGIGTTIKERKQPTIDQVMAWSKSFYPDLTSIRTRSVHYGGGSSWAWSSPQTKSGTIVGMTPQNDAKRLFEMIFGGGAAMTTSTTSGPARPPVVDRVIASYRALRQSNRRLSAGDKQRLDDHMDRLAELERRLKVVAPAACKAAPPTSDSPWLSQPTFVDSSGTYANSLLFYQVMNDIAVTAMLCGATQIMTTSVQTFFTDFRGSWHQDVAHSLGDPVKMAIMVESKRRTFEHVFLDLARKLDVEEAPGFNVLDNSLIMWTQEAGRVGHMGQDLPMVTIGSAGGFFKTGFHVNYNHPSKITHYNLRQGLMLNQWLSNCLQAMGLAVSEFQRPDNMGYGLDTVEPSWKYEPGVLAMAKAHQKLPVIT